MEAKLIHGWYVLCDPVVCFATLGGVGPFPTPKPTKHSLYVGQLLHIMLIFSNILKSCHSLVTSQLQPTYFIFVRFSLT